MSFVIKGPGNSMRSMLCWLILILSFALGYCDVITPSTSGYFFCHVFLEIARWAIFVIFLFIITLSGSSRLFKPIVATAMLCMLFFTGYSQNILESNDYIQMQKALKATPSGRPRIYALLIAGKSFIRMASEKPTLLDSALKYSLQAEQLSNQLKDTSAIAGSLLLSGEIYCLKKDLRSSIAIAERVISMLKNRPSSANTASAYTLLGDNISDSEKMSDQKIKYFQQAIAIYGQLHLEADKAKVFIKLSNVYLMGGKYQVMIDLLNNAKRIFDSLKYPGKEKDLQLVYEHFVYAHLGQDNYAEALRYGLLSVRIVEKNKDETLNAFRIYNNVALLNSLLKKYDHQVFFLNKALPIAKKYERQNNDSAMVAQVLGNIVLSKIAQQQPATAIYYLNKIGDRYPHGSTGWRQFINTNYLQAYTDEKDFSTAKKYYQLVTRQLAEFDQFHSHQTTNYNALINYLTVTRQLNAAYKYLALNDTACLRNSQVDLRAKNFLAWFKVDSLSGNLIPAIKHYQQYKVISDSLVNIKKAAQLSNLQVVYESEKKDEVLKLNAQKILLLKNKAQYQSVSLTHEKTIRYVTFTGAAMALLLFGLSYSRYRLKQKSNKKLEVQQEKLNEANQSLQSLNDSLKDLLTEKEWLLKEIHHRVKNNLQIVISLLNTQSSYLENEDALSALKNSQHRMHAMSLIHQKLYQSDNLAYIDMSVYIRELVDYLQESFNANKTIQINLMVDAVKFDVSQAVPLGLILNEAISNVIKYAFEPASGGKIDISLKPVDAHQYRLCIADNGRGLPDGFDIDNTSSMGMSLIQGLTGQLGGEFVLEDKNGLKVCITFENTLFNN